MAWLGRSTHWDVLNRFGSTRLAQTTILVPLIGYLILFSNDLVDYFKLIVDPTEHAGAAHLIRLYFLYFGFCGIGIGSAIFSLRCPAEVKDHGSAFDFIDKQFEIMTSSRQGAMERALKACNPHWQPASDAHDMRKGIMRDYFELLEESRPRSRFAVFTCFIVGGVLLAIPTAETFVLVLRRALQGL